MATIRAVRRQDKEYVLGYCSKTFGWGDYVEYVWDCWIRKGMFLAFEAHPSELDMSQGQEGMQKEGACTKPVGICHVHHSDGQIWIEGIRVHPQYRRRGIAARLVEEAERLALGGGGAGLGARNSSSNSSSNSSAEGRRLVSRMLIDTSNTASLSMAGMLGYLRRDTWIYYTLRLGQDGASLGWDTNNHNNNNGSTDDSAITHKVCNDKDYNHCHKHDGAAAEQNDSARKWQVEPARDDEIDPRVHTHYVRSWRWLDTDSESMRAMALAGTMLATHNKHDGSIECRHCGIISIIAISESVGRDAGPTLYCTFYAAARGAGQDDKISCSSCGDEPAKAMLCHIKDMASLCKCTSVEIFSQTPLPEYEPLTRRYDFCLVEKRLR